METLNSPIDVALKSILNELVIEEVKCPFSTHSVHNVHYQYLYIYYCRD